MQTDPAYITRLENLPEKEKKALLYGDWDIFEGQYFPEFSRKYHVIEPFEIPKTWRIYRTRDYGLDMTAVLWIAVDWNMNAYVYKEFEQSDLIISEAAAEINNRTTNDEKIYCDYAPPDMWNRQRETGRTQADIFAESGQYLTKSSNDRLAGWLALHEWLKLRKDEEGNLQPKLHIFSNCVNLIKHLPALQHDEKKVNDVATEPHEITHITDALRYFCVMYQLPPSIVQTLPKGTYTKTELEDLGYRDISTPIKTNIVKPISKRRR